MSDFEVFRNRTCPTLDGTQIAIRGQSYENRFGFPNHLKPSKTLDLQGLGIIRLSHLV